MSGKKGQPGSRGASGRDALDEDSGAQQGRNGNESATNTWANYRNASASPHRLERRTDGRDTPSFNVVRQQHSRTNQPPQRTQTPGHRAAMAFAQELTPTSSGTNPRMSRRDLYSTSYGPASSAASSDTSYEESSSPEIPEVQRKPQKQRTREPRMTEPSQRNPMPQGGADVDAVSSAEEEDMDVDAATDGGGTDGNERNIVHRQPKWTEDENLALAHAAHEDSDPLRARFQGGSGGKERKKAAWARVARAVNIVSKCGRSVKECYKKLGYLQSAAKKKNLELRRKYARSGAGGIPKKEQLTELDRLVLSFMGEEPVSGIPGLAPTPLVRVDERELLASGGSTQFGGANRRRNSPTRSGNQSHPRNRARTPRSATVSHPGNSNMSSAPLPPSQSMPATADGSGFLDLMTTATDDSASMALEEAATNGAIDEVNTIEIDNDFRVTEVADSETDNITPRDRPVREPFQFVQAAADNLRPDQILPDIVQADANWQAPGTNAVPMPVDGPGPNEFHLQELTPDGAGNVQPRGPVVTGTLPHSGAGGNKYTQGAMSLSQVFQSLLSRPAEDMQTTAEGTGDPDMDSDMEPAADMQTAADMQPTPGGVEMTLDDVLTSVHPTPNNATPRPPMAADQASVGVQQSGMVLPEPQPPLPFHVGFGRELLQQLHEHFARNSGIMERMVNTQEQLTEQLTTGFGREILQCLDQNSARNSGIMERMVNTQEQLTEQLTTGFGREILQCLDQNSARNSGIMERMVNTQEQLTEQLTTGFGREILQCLDQNSARNSGMMERMVNTQEQLTAVSARLADGLCALRQNPSSTPRSIMTQTDVTYVNDFGIDAPLPQQHEVQIVAITDVTAASVHTDPLPDTEATVMPADSGEQSAMDEAFTDQPSGNAHVPETAVEVVVEGQDVFGIGDGDSTVVHQAAGIPVPVDENGMPKTAMTEASTSSASKSVTEEKATPEAGGDSRPPPATVPRFGRPCTRQRQPRRAYSWSKTYGAKFK